MEENDAGALWVSAIFEEPHKTAESEEQWLQ